MYSREELASGFRALGVAAGDTVMVHASVKAVGEVAGGPDQIHLALKDALSPVGTLIMYASCPRFYDEVGRGDLGPSQEAELLEKLPAFDPYTARSARDNGALVELLRTYPGSSVNNHVARFVVWGGKARHIVGQQPWDYAFGLNSPLDRFQAFDGKILLLGSDHDAVTFLHYVEHVAQIPNRRIARFRVPVEEQGCRVWREMEEVDTGDRAHENWPDRFFGKIVDALLSESGNAGGLVGDAKCYLFSARRLLEFSQPIMEAVARDASAASGLKELS